jgi:hypothetical protein
VCFDCSVENPPSRKSSEKCDPHFQVMNFSGMRMIKKKARGKTAVKKSGGKRRSGKKQLDAAQVREEIAGMVKAGAKQIAEAVMGQAIINGELAPAKYLFEVASIYPPSTDGSQSLKEEDSLAKTLMDRLNLPDEPIARDEDGEPVLPTKSQEENNVADEATGEKTEAGPQV